MARRDYEKRRRKQIVDERGPLPYWYEQWRPSTYPEVETKLPSRDFDEPLAETDASRLDPAMLDFMQRMVEPFMRRLESLSESDREEFDDLLASLDSDTRIRVIRFLLAFAADNQDG